MRKGLMTLIRGSLVILTVIKSGIFHFTPLSTNRFVSGSGNFVVFLGSVMYVTVGFGGWA
jgi:hypothetical protein